MTWRGVAALVLSAVTALRAPAQSPAAPPRADTLPVVVVTAERSRASLVSVTTAVTRVGAEELARMPDATLADVLRRVPGFAVVDFDGLGRDPQLMVRGFYGGGEAEYVLVLVDGQPLARLESGLVPWDVLPPIESIEAVEVVRGGASPLYGDAAMGAVINVLTRTANAANGSGARASWQAGSQGVLSASGDLAGRVGGHAASFAGGAERTTGFRAHARRESARVQGSYGLMARDSARLSLSLRGQWRDFDEPGPLLESLMASDRRQSDALFRFDHSTDREVGLGLRAEREMGAGMRVSGGLATERRGATAVRTLALAPGFGDTRERELRSARHSASAQLDFGGTGTPGADVLVLGIEAATGTLDSKYFGIVGGDRSTYEASGGARGPLDASGDGRRSTAAAFAHWAVPLSGVIRLSLAGRLDVLRDAFEPGEPQPGERLTARHVAFSPRAGLNVRYLRRPGASGHAFITWSRSFKAPTPDQLFDQRPVPVPFPPFSITISNALLEPQRAAGVEGGVYQELALGDARAAATVGLYQMDLKNELDFDVQALRYVNIGRSRHRGLELGMTLSAPPGVSAFANYTLQSAESRAGATAGHQLKALPRHVVALGASVTAPSGLEAGATLTRLHRMYLDDENTRAIPAWSRADLRLGWRVGTARLALDVYNALDARYATTGFLDPAGTGEAYWHPAAGRRVRFGVSRDW